MLSNVLAPACNELPAGIALHGPGAENVGEAVAETLGCLMYSVYDAPSAREAIETEHAHRWPVVFRLASTVQRRHQKLLLESDEKGYRNCVMSLDWYHAMTKAVEGSWQVIVGQELASASRGILATASRLLPAYLQDICQRGLHLDRGNDPQECFVEVVLRDLARFVKERHGNPADVLSAKDVLWFGREAGNALALADLLGRFIREGKLGVEEEGYAKRKPALIQVPSVEGLFLSCEVLAKMLRDKHVPMLDKSAITATLCEADLLIEDRADGWVFPARWLEGQLRRVYAEAAGLLRVHG